MWQLLTRSTHSIRLQRQIRTFYWVPISSSRPGLPPKARACVCREWWAKSTSRRREYADEYRPDFEGNQAVATIESFRKCLEKLALESFARPSHGAAFLEKLAQRAAANGWTPAPARRPCFSPIFPGCSCRKTLSMALRKARTSAGEKSCGRLRKPSSSNCCSCAGVRRIPVHRK